VYVCVCISIEQILYNLLAYKEMIIQVLAMDIFHKKRKEEKK